MKFRTAVTAVTLTIGSMAVLPTLSASAAWSDCPSAKVCLFQNSGGGGELLKTRSTGGGRVDVGAAADNRTSSWWNRTGGGARWYPGLTSDKESDCFSMPAGVQQSYTSSQLTLNDRASSWATNGNC